MKQSRELILHTTDNKVINYYNYCLLYCIVGIKLRLISLSLKGIVAMNVTEINAAVFSNTIYAPFNYILLEIFGPQNTKI